MKPKRNIRSILIKNLLLFLVIAAIVWMFLIDWATRSLFMKGMEDHATAVAEIVRAGLTSHMKAEIMDKRGFFLEEIKSAEKIRSLTIARSAKVKQQYGHGLASERQVDTFTQQVFDSKRPLFLVNGLNQDPIMRAIIPYVATSSGELNCMKCHKVLEGTVLGAVDIQIDIGEYRERGLFNQLVIFATFTLFLFLIVSYTFNSIQRIISQPLESIISRAREAYYKRRPIDQAEFESLELKSIAQEINLFNQELVKSHDQLEEKNLELSELNEEIESTLKETIYTIGLIEAHRSEETNYHTKRVTEYSRLLGELAGLCKRDTYVLHTASPLHDIGKLAIPDSILKKCSALDEQEYEVIKNHTEIGYEMLRHSDREILKAAAIIAHQHQEKWDGTGYPQGLKGEEIHIYGRIVSLVDVFDALSMHRCYKEAWSMEKVIAHIRHESGRQFAPGLVDLFLSNLDLFIEIQNLYHSDKAE